MLGVSPGLAAANCYIQDALHQERERCKGIPGLRVKCAESGKFGFAERIAGERRVFPLRDQIRPRACGKDFVGQQIDGAKRPGFKIFRCDPAELAAYRFPRCKILPGEPQRLVKAEDEIGCGSPGKIGRAHV